MGKKAVEMGRYGTSELMRNKNLQKKAVNYGISKLTPFIQDSVGSVMDQLLRSTLGERFVIFGDPVVDGIPVHARREDSRFLVTWTGDVQNLRHFE